MEGVVGDGYLADGDGSFEVRSYTAGVAYYYIVDGLTYRSSVISYRYALAFATAGAAIRAKAPYQRGTKVRVYYDPKSPRVATLEPGSGWRNYLSIAIGGTGVVLSTGLLYAAF